MTKIILILHINIKFYFIFTQKSWKMNRIKSVLKEQGRSQMWLSEKLGKSYVMVTNYCNNKTQPSIETLNEIAEILDVDVRFLLESNKESKIVTSNGY